MRRALLLCALLALGGCPDWGRHNPLDPARCDPACSGGRICREGKCVLASDLGGGDGGGLDCTSRSCTDYVVSALILAKDIKQAATLGYDYDNDGVADNAYGRLVAGFGDQIIDLQPVLDAAFNQGSAILLLRVSASDLQNEPAARARAFSGAAVQCCSAGSAPSTCASAARTTCFSGTYRFAVDSTQNPDAYFDGSLAAGALRGARMLLVLPFLGASAPLPLKGVRIEGTFAKSGITSGKITGGIDVADVERVLLPAITAIVDNLAKDPSTPKTDKDRLLLVFDGDSDGTISLDEVRANPVVKSAVTADVDVDGDGKLDLSIGVGFSAVNAVIEQP